MTPETRRNVLRYGIAIDLVVLATGAGMLLPASPAVLLLVFAGAVLLSIWKGGWQGGLTALLLSLAALAWLGVPAKWLALFAGAMALTGAATAMALRSRTPELQPAVVDVPAALPVAPQPVVDSQEAERAAREEKRAAKKRAQAERDRARIEQERAAAERKRADAEARAAKQREEAERERARLEAERAAAERARAEAEALAAKEREENERLAREREAAERERVRLEAEREAAERARVEAEAVAKERAAAERARAEAEALAAKEREESARLAREREEAAREAARLEAEREAAAALAKAREEAERERLRLEAEREAAERARVEAEALAAKEREESERLAREREAAEREAAATLAKQREEAERERLRLESEREAAERARAEAEALAAKEREELAQERARIEAERRGAEEKMRQELDAEREAMRARLEQQFAAEREALAREAEVRDADVRAAAAAKAAVVPPPAPTPAPTPALPQHAAAPAPVKHAPPAAPKPSLLDTVTGWFKREPRPRTVNLKTKRINGNDTASRRAQQVAPPRRPAPVKVRNPRIVLLERRRGTADTVLPKLRQRGIEVSVVERWIDAVDELLRVKPDAFFLDVEHPDFDKAQRMTREKSHMPLILTGRSPSAAPPNVLYAAFVPRPYDVEELTRLAQIAMSRPDELLALQSIQRTPPAQPRPSTPPPRASTPPVAPPSAIRRTPVPASSSTAMASAMAAAAAEPMVPRKPSSNDEYEVQCFSCRIGFNAVDADWCSCLAKERTLVCTNCLSCFCKAPPAFKEKFWVEAPPKLFERKTAEARRQQGLLPANPGVGEVTRPLVLTVEDDEDIQAIVQRVCANLGYGFVYAMNGQDGLDMAREYHPNLILSDAFMPKLDGREMCRMLKEEPEFAETRMVVMTGLYTDTKYRSEAVKRFHIDDYIAKPVAITDLINLLQRHLEGVSGLPVQDDLHEMHRREVEEAEEMETTLEDMPLADVLAPMSAPPMEIAARPAPAPKPDGYPVCCFNCQENFDATHAEWCRCVGRDNTLVCDHCGGCFCKAPAPYKERFWIDAPPSLFERKMIGSKRALSARANPPANDVKRPLILLVEDDENVQLIVRTVVTTMGYGFVVGANGQEGLSLAREYSPDLILSDAFMPKLDGREMCRLLKEDPTTSRSKAIIMTGLYTDRKYRNEALDYFKVDDYVAKPLAVDDLIKLFKKHLPQEVATAH